MSKKKALKNKTILALFRHCEKTGDFEFDNELVKKISKKTGFGNPYDATKIDNTGVLPKEVRDAGYCIAHLGQGRHRFIKEIDAWYHRFEAMDDADKSELTYKPSLLNHTDTSESNIISLVYNQRIIQEFLYEDRAASPKIYLSRRTKITASYRVGRERIEAKNLQMEMDATFENNGIVTVLEGKNDPRKTGDSISDFSVYQLFHPFLSYKNVPNVSEISCCYLLQKALRNPEGGENIRIIRLYLYTFADPNDMSSIKLIKKAQYTFKQNK